MLVATPPGQIALHRMFSSLKRHAMFFVAPTSPCLLAVKAIPAIAPDVAALLATLTMLPRCCLRIQGRVAWINLTGAVRLIEIQRSHIASVTESALLLLSVTPATLSRPSIFPYCAIHFSTTVVAVDGSARSPWTKIQFTACCSDAGLGEISTPSTFAPPSSAS